MRNQVLVAFAICASACGKTREVNDAAVPNQTELNHPPAPTGPGLSRGPLRTEADALVSFDAAFTEEVRPALVTWHPAYARYNPPLFDRVARITCRHASKEQEDAQELSRLFGDRSAIARDGDCWVLYHEFWGALHPYAVLDAETGALLFASRAVCG